MASLGAAQDAVVEALPGFVVRVTNKTKRALEGVEVVIQLDPPVGAVKHNETAYVSRKLLPDRPRKRGPDPLPFAGGAGNRNTPFRLRTKSPSVDERGRPVRWRDRYRDRDWPVAALEHSNHTGGNRAYRPPNLLPYEWATGPTYDLESWHAPLSPPSIQGYAQTHCLNTLNVGQQGIGIIFPGSLDNPNGNVE